MGPIYLWGLASRGLAHFCTAAWKRCRRAVQSLPPLNPTQSWVRLYKQVVVHEVSVMGGLHSREISLDVGSKKASLGE